jgi:iron complex outermembrane receptor protein
MNRKFFAFVAVILLLLPSLTFAQFSISGYVKDNNGNPLPSAAVVLLNTKYQTLTNKNGFYSLKQIPKGTYTIKVSYVGYISQIKKIKLDHNLKINFILNPSVNSLSEIVVTALRADSRTPIAYTNLPKTTIQERNLAPDMPYILRLTPSVVVSSDAGNGVGYTQIRIRGTDITRINVTINGIPLNDAESHGVWWVDLPDIAGSIQSIQIQRGVGTSTNGAGAFGATINLNTTKMSDKPYAQLVNTVGSFNTWKHSINFGTGKLHNHFSFVGRLSKIWSDGYIDRAWANLKSLYLAGSYFTKNTFISAIVFSGFEETYQAWYGVPKDSLKTHRTYNPYHYDNEIDHYIQTHYQFIIAHKFSPYLKLQTIFHYTKGAGYYEQYKKDQAYSAYGLKPLIIGLDTITHTNLIRRKWLDNGFYGLVYTLTYSKGNFSTALGGAWNKYDGWHFGRIIWMQYAGNIPIRYEWYRNRGIKTDFNIYSKTHYTIADKLNIFLDMQIRTINYDISGIHDDLRNITQQHHYTFFNPKFGFLYQLSPYQNIYASFAVAHREPKRRDFIDAPSWRTPVPERLYDWEAGYKFNNPKLYFNINLYYMNYINQMILTGEINDVGDPIVTNVPHSFRRGIELVWGFKPLKWLDWNANLTLSQNKILNYIDHIDDWDNWPHQIIDTLGTTDISFSPDVIAASDLLASFLHKHLFIEWTSKYVSRQYIDNTSNKERSLDPYWVNNLRFEYILKTKKFIPETHFIFQINNIFNEMYETYAWVYKYYYHGKLYEENGYFPQAPRNYLFTIRMDF